MKRLKPIDFSDLVVESKMKYKQMSIEQKKNYISKLKAMRNFQKDERQRRIDDIREPGRRLYFVKVVNNSIDRNSLPLTFNMIYSDEEIEMAKKCILNHWIHPPISYFELSFSRSTMLPTNQNVETIDDINVKFFDPNLFNASKKKV